MQETCDVCIPCIRILRIVLSSNTKGAHVTVCLLLLLFAASVCSLLFFRFALAAIHMHMCNTPPWIVPQAARAKQTQISLQATASQKPSVDTKSISRRSHPSTPSRSLAEAIRHEQVAILASDRHAFDAIRRRHGVVAASSQNLGHPVLQAARHLRSQSGSRIVVLIVVAPVSLLISALALFFELKIRSSVPGVHRTSPRRRRRSRM